jgi:lipopolysaccharide transport system permease protein
MLASAIKLIINYRGFILGNVKREFQLKYRNSLLGAAWNVLNPLAMILVYTVIFSRVMHAKMPGIGHTFSYSIYLCSGSLVWGLFSEIVNRAQNVFVENANLLKKISFPRLCLPATVICNALLNFSIVFFLFTLFLLISGNFPGTVFIALIPVLILLIFFAIGLGISLGVLNVFFRDVGQFFSIILQFWFWFTPIVYPVSILPERMLPFFKINPVTPIIISCQTIITDGKWPSWESLYPTLLISIALVYCSILLLRKHAGEMIDEL